MPCLLPGKNKIKKPALTQDTLDEIGARKETSSRKSLRRLAV
jgi:hypothetical protein